MTVRTTIAFDISDDVLRAVEIRGGRGPLEVVRALCVDRPASVSAENAGAYGHWIGEVVRHAGFPASGDVVVAIDRERCSLRMVELPTDDESELPDMARLAAQRDTPAEAGALVVDIVARSTGERSTKALLATAPERSIELLRQLAAAAGYRAARITPRTLGTACLLRVPQGETAVTVAVDLSGDAVELVVVDEGGMRHSRGVRVDRDDYDAALVSETKRSWAAWRLGAAEVPLARIVVMGDARSSELIRESLADSFAAPIDRFTPGPRLRVAPTADDEALSRAWPLVGLLIEANAGEETINFASPRKAPDLAARRRMRVLAGAGAVLIASLLGWTAGRQSWKSLESEVEATGEQVASGLPLYEKYKRDTARNLHVSMWRRATPQWLDHLRFLHGFASDPSKVVFDRWNGTLDASDVQYGRDGTWSIEHEVTILLQGEARDRTAADALRDALVDDARYSLTSTGPDTEGGRRLKSPFSYVLRSDDPQSPLAAGGATSAGGAQP